MQGCFLIYSFFFTCAYCSFISSRKQHVEIIMIIIRNMQIRCKKKKKRQTLFVSQHWVSWSGSKERFAAVFQRVQKGDMTTVVKDGASVETQWLTQTTAIKNHGGILFECSITGFRFFKTLSSTLLRVLSFARSEALHSAPLTEQNHLSPILPSLLSLLLLLFV